MTRAEHLLVILMEECSEVAQRASKALRFGLDEIQPGQEFSNSARLEFEIDDLVAAVEMLREDGHIRSFADGVLVRKKCLRVEELLRYSAKCGTLQSE